MRLISTLAASLPAVAIFATAALAGPAEDAASQFFERYDAQDVDGMVELFAESASVHYVPFGPPGSLEEVGVAGWRGLIDAFPDLSNNVRSIRETADGRFAYVDVDISGTQAKDAFGIESQGRSYDVRHLFVVGVDEEGLITEMTAFWDNATWFRQLGRTDLTAGE